RAAIQIGPARSRHRIRSGRPGVRREYDHQPDAPAASCVAPCAFVAVRDITGRLLLVRRCDTGDWELPGGHVDPGESASDAAVRCRPHRRPCMPHRLTSAIPAAGRLEYICRALLDIPEAAVGAGGATLTDP